MVPMGDRNRAAHLEIGRRIRTRREELGLSREEVAERAGVDIETLEKIERGELELGLETLLAFDAEFAGGPDPPL